MEQDLFRLFYRLFPDVPSCARIRKGIRHGALAPSDQQVPGIGIKREQIPHVRLGRQRGGAARVRARQGAIRVGDPSAGRHDRQIGAVQFKRLLQRREARVVHPIIACQHQHIISAGFFACERARLGARQRLTQRQEVSAVAIYEHPQHVTVATLGVGINQQQQRAIRCGQPSERFKRRLQCGRIAISQKREGQHGTGSADLCRQSCSASTGSSWIKVS
ncbi:hypothetical protein [Roseovarius sp. Pro17]|uniref:hypothetical protein n=1 Tax=Roseovarius sp. Pro17 TaxID=3108175 RepID=UPI002D769B4C|nr:hypothetical protein [Roseovarius sp. Pro17]